MDDRYGWSVDIDGDFAVVGAYGDDFAAANPNMGSAYILQKVGTEWIQIQKIFSTYRDDYDRFGWSVAIDGDDIIIGAYQEDHNLADADPKANAGSAYIFERNEDGDWAQVDQPTINLTNQAKGSYLLRISNEFGYAVHKLEVK